MCTCVCEQEGDMRVVNLEEGMVQYVFFLSVGLN